MLKIFFSHLKEKTGELHPKWFMTDMAEQYNAWTAVYDGSPIKLLCTWHVDRAWRKNLTSIPNEEKKRRVYHMLRVYCWRRVTEKFECLLIESVAEWQYYVQRSKHWAACYRKHAINTNMFAESFHRVMKHVYLKGTINKRLDSFINIFTRQSVR